MSKQIESKTNLSSQSTQNAHNSHNLHNLQNLSTEQLRSLLKELENEHDIAEAKNEELATHVIS